MSDTFTRFWLIWCPTAPARWPPTTRFTSEHQARTVAAKLATANPGQAFVVMAAVAGYQAGDLAIVEAKDPPEPPEPPAPPMGSGDARVEASDPATPVEITAVHSVTPRTAKP